MAARKPWESTVPMSSQPVPSSINTGLFPTVESARTPGAAPPPPPRTVVQQLPQQQQQQMGFFPNTGYMNPYSMGSYYGQPSPFYNNSRFLPYGAQTNMPASNFAQLAMDESRTAFSSIESVVQTFRSITMMLESTFTSVYSSFRAVTDVFDHFSRLHYQMSALYPLVLVWRFLKFLLDRLLRLLRLRRQQPSNQDSWSAIYESLQRTTATTTTPGIPTSDGQSSSGWLVALFFVVTFGTPMLMLKFLNSMIKKRQDANNWLQQDKNQARVMALYDYVARNADELSFTRGTIIYLAPTAFQSTTSHWFLGTVDRIHTGLIPANYVQPLRTSPSSAITLHPQTPFDVTRTTPPAPPPPSISNNNTDIPLSTIFEEQQPTLS